jgi:trimethylamine--corrinoid protein Co-methyltransferase
MELAMQEGAVVPKPLRLFDSGDIQVIHDAALQILSKLGVVYEAKWALDLLKEVGCNVDYASKRVRIPEQVVDEAIKKSPSVITLCGRDSKFDIKLEGTRVYFAGGANAVRVVDYSEDKFTARSATAKDLVQLTILTDAMENIHCYLPPVYPQDVPPRGVDRLKCEIALNHTEKPLYHDSEGYEGALDQIRMASLVLGGEDNLRKRPLISLAPCITSPLSWSEPALGTLKACAEKGVPSIISSEPIAGATSPVTLAGSLMQQCAEILSGLVVAHSLNPGTPTIACTLPSIMDMRTANIVLSSVETGMMSAGAAQIFREFYGMPYAGGGCVSDSKLPDQQRVTRKLSQYCTEHLEESTLYT